MEVLADAGPGKTSLGDSEGMVTVGVGCGRALGAGKEIVSLSLLRKWMGEGTGGGHEGCRWVTLATGFSHKVLVPQWHFSSSSPEHLSPCALDSGSLVGTTLT